MKQDRNGPEDFQIYTPSPEAFAAARYDVSDTDEHLGPGQLLLSRICRVIAAAILCETLWFKFTGHPESVAIFTKMNMEAWGRYGQGSWELAASVLMFTPRLKWLGLMLALGAMGAAILSHISVLGIAVQNDHGLLFAMACTTFVCALVALWIHQRAIPRITRLDDSPE
jgi:putative oxidoreductase